MKTMLRDKIDFFLKTVFNVYLCCLIYVAFLPYLSNDLHIAASLCNLFRSTVALSKDALYQQYYVISPVRIAFQKYFHFCTMY